MTPLTPMEEQILHYLDSARNENTVTPKRPITGYKISERFGLGGNQEVRGIIHNLRAHGHWIGATAKGYYMARTWDEIRETVASLKARSRSIAVPANAMLAKAAREDQLELV